MPHPAPRAPSRHRVRPIAALLAVVLPFVILGGAWVWLDAPTGPTGKALAMDRELLESGPPDVVVLGSSLARTNVDLDVLAKGLDIPRRRIVLLTLPNATAAHWYAVMENRLFAQGYRPRLVLMVGALTTMVTPDVLMDTNGERLVNLLGEHEPVIAAKVFKSDDPLEYAWLSLRERAGQLRDAWVEGWRDRVLSVVFRGRGDAHGGARLAARANATVFADDRMEYTLHEAQPTGLYLGEVEQLDLSGLDVARDSLIPDIAALAAAHGSRAVFVRTPFPPSNADNDLVPPDVERAAVGVMADSGASYVDLRGLNLDESHFRDLRHMSVEGARVFTRALVRTLVDAGLLDGDRPLVTGLRPSRTSRTTAPWPQPVFVPSGGCAWTAPSAGLAPLSDLRLAELGAAGGSPVRVEVDGVALPHRAGLASDCTPGFLVGPDVIRVVLPEGADARRLVLSLDPSPSFTGASGHEDFWWVYPGTRLELSFDEPWSHEREAFAAMVLGQLVGAGDLSQVRVTVFDQAVPLRQDGDRVWADLRPAEVPVDRPWSVAVEVAKGGPFLWLRNLAIGASPYTTHVIGRSDTLFGTSARLVGGRQSDTGVISQFAAAPPSLVIDAPLRPAPRGTASLALPGFAALADAPDQRTSKVDRCSPLRVLEDGVPLPGPQVPCLEMANLKEGRSCHAGGAMFFAASDSTNPATNGRRYTVGLDPSRVCERRAEVENTTPMRDLLWLYPGDRVEIVAPAAQLQTFRRGADLFEIAADPFLARPGARLHVALYAAGRLVREEDVTAGEDGAREFRRRLLDPPLPPMLDDIRLVVSNTDPDAWWLLVSASVSESSPFTPTLDGATVDRASGSARDPEAPAYAEGEADRLASGPALFDDPQPVDGLRPPVSVTRLGPVPAVAAPTGTTPRDGVVEVRLTDLWPVSQAALSQRALGWVSPLRAELDGVALRPATSRRSFRDPACLERCFLHGGESVSLRTTRPDALAHLRLFLSPDLPMVAPHGERVYWAYPGTRLRLTWNAPWTDPGAYVDVRLSELRADRAGAQPAARLVIGGEERIFQPGEAWSASRVYLGAPAPGPLVVEVIVPEDSAISLLRGIELVDGAHRWTLLPDPADQAVTVEN